MKLKRIISIFATLGICMSLVACTIPLNGIADNQTNNGKETAEQNHNGK